MGNEQKLHKSHEAVQDELESNYSKKLLKVISAKMLSFEPFLNIKYITVGTSFTSVSRSKNPLVVRSAARILQQPMPRLFKSMLQI